MATLKKNTPAKAAAEVEEKPAKTSVKTGSKVASKKAPEPEPEPEVEAEVFGKKDIASYIQDYVKADGKAVPINIATLAVEAYEQFVLTALSQRDSVRTSIGKFVVTEQAEREARNPQTGEAITVPARLVPKFKASANLKAAVNAEEVESEQTEEEAEEVEE